MEGYIALLFLVTGTCFFMTGTTYLIRQLTSPCHKED